MLIQLLEYSHSLEVHGATSICLDKWDKQDEQISFADEFVRFLLWDCLSDYGSENHIRNCCVNLDITTVDHHNTQLK